MCFDCGSTIVEIIGVLKTYITTFKQYQSTIVEIIGVLKTTGRDSNFHSIYNSRNYWGSQNSCLIRLLGGHLQ